MVKKNEEQIPLFKKWSGWYWTLVVVLGLLIVFFIWFTKHYS